MKILLALAAFALAAALVVSATMGAGTLVPGGDDRKKKPGGGLALPPSGKARLLPTGFAPPTLKGTGFKPGENVTVQIRDNATPTKKRVKASSSGSFTVRLAARVDRCNGMTVTAVGDQGSRASFQLSELLCAVQ
jgi:hypothetical protein